MAEAKESENASKGTVPCSTGCCCVYGFGYNGFSQLDLNSNKDKHQGMTVSSPIRVPTLDSNITRVVGSWTTTVSLRGRMLCNTQGNDKCQSMLYIYTWY